MSSAVAPTPASFNPRLRTGGDSHHFTTILFQALFQSTPPHGRRQEARSMADGIAGFQSTPPHGRRRACVAYHGPHQWVSIHASAREATACHPALRNRQVGFNPRLRTGGDGFVGEKAEVVLQVSIHASAREATQHHPMSCGTFFVSIHASAREATVTGVGLRG